MCVLEDTILVPTSIPGTWSGTRVAALLRAP